MTTFVFVKVLECRQRIYSSSLDYKGNLRENMVFKLEHWVFSFESFDDDLILLFKQLVLFLDGFVQLCGLVLAPYLLF